MSMKKKDTFEAFLNVFATISGGDEKDVRTDYVTVKKEIDGVKIRVGVFFDGTGNNKFNTESRLEYEKDNIKYGPLRNREAYIYQQRLNEEKSGKKTKGVIFKYEEPIDIADSYSNYYSNVAILFKHYETQKDQDELKGKVYVEGIGTSMYDDDPLPGKAFGAGKTGIPERVKEACQDLADKIKELANEKKIESLKIDVFGFSRGAAAARHFVNEISKKEKTSEYGELGESLKKVGVTIKSSPQIVFAGLFDTVSSYKGVHILNLNIGKAKNVLHLTAKDERRANFPLTDISSKDIKYEKALPGVHSDIGGGYNPIVSEGGKIIFQGTREAIDEEIEFLTDHGWFKNNGDLGVDLNSSKRGGSISYGRLKITKREIKNNYSYLPLHIMMEKASSTKDIKFSNLTDEFGIEQQLKRVYIKLKKFVFNEGQPMTFYTRNELNKKIEILNSKIDKQFDLTKKQLVSEDFKDYAEIKRMVEDHNDLMLLRSEYFHISHDSSILFRDTGLTDIQNAAFNPFKSSIREPESRNILQG